ncbi:MAG: Fur family transcriptional regulator [Desertimonas sp.]
MTLEEALRAGNHRITKPRLIVWEVLNAAGGHLSAAEVAERAGRHDAAINVSSVYRTLALFAELGLVRGSRLGDEATWEPRHDDAVVHLVCDGCGTVLHHGASAMATLRRQLDADTDFEVHAIDVRVTGRCHRCRSNVDSARSTSECRNDVG